MSINVRKLRCPYKLAYKLDRGFRSLIVAMGIFTTQVTPEVVERSLQDVKVKDVQAWREEHLPKSVASSKSCAYAQYRETKNNRATLSANAA